VQRGFATASSSSSRGRGGSVAAASPAAASPAAAQEAAAAAAAAMRSEREVRPGVYEGYWQWQGHRIRYQRCGDAGPPVLCVHG
jgi:hypothetical protein